MSNLSTINDLNSDVLTQILLHLDGPDLAAASATSTLLCSTASATWHHLCLSTWPSLADPRLLPLLSSSFFADALCFPLPSLTSSPSPPPPEFISAIDLHYNDRTIFSTVIATETQSPWFQSAPFRVDAFDAKTPPALAISSVEDLTLSWILIDPIRRKGVNVSSRRAVAVERHWCDETLRVKFSVAIGDRAAAVVDVTLEGDGRQHVREMGFAVEDGEEGTCMNGTDAAKALTSTMDGPKTWKKAEEVRQRYEEYERGKAERRRKQVRAELGCALVGATAFTGFLAMLIFH